MAAQLGATSALGFRRELNGLRGVAIGMVFLHHLYAPLFAGADTGVDLFFVLSGFLITKLAVEERDRRGNLSVPDFFTRRAFRIVPTLAVLLAFMLVSSWTWLADIGHTVRAEVGYSAIAAGNLVPAFEGYLDEPVLGHTWSLGVEEQFYLLWPIVLFALWSTVRATANVEKVLLVGAVGAFVVGRGVLHLALDYPHWASLPFMNSDGIMLGAFLAVRYHRGAAVLPARVASWLPVVALGILAVDVFMAASYIDDDHLLLRVLVVRLCWYVVLAAVVTRVFDGWGVLQWGLLGYLGLISYSLYLWHAPLFLLFDDHRFPTVPMPMLVVLRVLVSLALAVASYHLLERPMVQRGRRVLAHRHERERPVEPVIDLTTPRQPVEAGNQER